MISFPGFHRVLVPCLVLALVLSAPALAQDTVPETPRERIESFLPEQPDLERAVIVEPAPADQGAEVDMFRWSRMAVQSFRDRNWEVYVGQPGGPINDRVTAHPAADLHPELGPEATQLVFASNRNGNYDLFVVNPDGSGLRQLTSAPQDEVLPSWSPDGTRIAYTSYRDGQPEIYVIGVDGRGEQRLTFNADPQTGNAFDSQPDWSPDSRQIAFTSKRNGGYRIWIMNADGSGARMLPTPPFSQNPTWSPDGQFLILDADADGNGFQELYRINATGSGLSALDSGLGTPFNEFLAMAVSPNGLLYAFTQLMYEEYQGQLYITRMEIALRRFDAQTGYSGGIGNFDLGTAWRSLDTRSPISRVSTAAAFTRAIGSPVTVVAQDVGVSGLDRVEVQVRVGDGDWTTWQSLPAAEFNPFVPTVRAYQGTPGAQIFFRSRAVDRAGNVEPWHPAPDTSTQLFVWEQPGLALDNRNFPVAGLVFSSTAASIEPTRSQADGRFLLHVLDSGPHAVAVPGGAFGALPARSLVLNADQPLAFTLSPSDNVIRNGSFESATPFEGWTVAGNLTATVESAYGSAGRAAASLGRACRTLRPCYTETRQFSLPGQPITFVDQITVVGHDTRGASHLLVQNQSGWRYRVISVEGATLVDEVLSFPVLGTPVAAVSPDGTLHLVQSPGTDQLEYRQRTSQGWSAAQGIPLVVPQPRSFTAIKLAADGLGRLHLVADKGQGLNPVLAITRRADGTWGPGQTLGTGLYATVAADATGTAYAVWLTGNTVQLAAGQPDGSWVPYGALPIPPFNPIGSAGQPQLLMDDGGRIHVLVTPPWSSSSDLELQTIHAYYEPRFGRWFIDSLAQATETAWLTQAGLVGASGDFLRHQITDRVWSDPWLLEGRLTASVDALDRVRLIGNRGDTNGRVEYTTRLSPVTGTASLSQTVSLPASLHAPTLAFSYRLTGANPHRNSGLTVFVGNTPVYTDVVGSTLRQAWVDVSAWAGQTVTVRFALTRQSPSDANTELYLDDVSLGSWLTPVVTAVNPTQLVDASAGQRLTLTGANFIGQPEIRIGDQVLTDVQRVDAQTLTGMLATAIRPGQHDVVVVNPGGQSAGLVGALLTGQRVYLPAVAR